MWVAVTAAAALGLPCAARARGPRWRARRRSRAAALVAGRLASNVCYMSIRGIDLSSIVHSSIMQRGACTTARVHVRAARDAVAGTIRTMGLADPDFGYLTQTCHRTY